MKLELTGAEIEKIVREKRSKKAGGRQYIVLENMDLITKLRNQGLSYASIAEVFQERGLYVSKHTIWRVYTHRIRNLKKQSG